MDKIPALLKKDSVSRVLLVTTAGFMRRGTLTGLISALQASGIRVTVFSNVIPDPTIECVEQALGVYRSSNSSAILAIGGGSEVTAGAVITDEATHTKYAIMDYCIVPDYAILDPALCLGLPASITSVTGMDAPAHAAEAYTNRFASPKAKKSAKEAVRLTCQFLPTAYSDGTQLLAREKMLLASYYAGVAITNAYVGYIHALAHAVGGMYSVTHGLANAVIMPYVLEEYDEAITAPLTELANVVGIKAGSREQDAKAFIASIRQMNETMGIPAHLIMIQTKDH